VLQELHLAALRRAWVVDPALGDFKGLQENAWNFDDPNSTPGFGELGPGVDVNTIVAQISGEAPAVATRALTNQKSQEAFRSLPMRSGVGFSTSPSIDERGPSDKWAHVMLQAAKRSTSAAYHPSTGVSSTTWLSVDNRRSRGTKEESRHARST
jgi:hypothetical protein